MSSSYAINSLFFTIQGEGYHTGTVSVFCRFAGCNLWSGKEKSRPKAACRFCDTEFVGMGGENGGRYSTKELVDKLVELWGDSPNPFVVFTGGEPLLQLNEELIQACKAKGFYIAVETNGTKKLPQGIDWVCLSPKPRSKRILTKASELKLIFPQLEEEMAPEIMFECQDGRPM